MRVNVDDLYYSDDALLLLHEGKPFTGLAFELNLDGWLEYEVPYLDGRKNGISLTYYPSGQHAAEESYALGAFHGPCRYYSDGGKPTSERIYEHGIRTSERRFDEDGRLVSESHLSEGDPDYKTLQLRRQRYSLRTPSNPR